MIDVVSVNPHLSVLLAEIDRAACLAKEEQRLVNETRRVEGLLRDIPTTVISLAGRTLQYALREQGVGVCHRVYEHRNDPTEQGKLGVVGFLDLRVLFESNFHSSKYHDWRESYLSLLCLRHYPRIPYKVTPYRYYPEDMRWADVTSAVMRRDGKYLALDQCHQLIDVTEIPVKRHYLYELFDMLEIPFPYRYRSGVTTDRVETYHSTLGKPDEFVSHYEMKVAGPSRSD